MTFELYTDAKGEWRWRLKSGNGEIVASSEGYASKQMAIKAINTVRTKSWMAKIKEVATINPDPIPEPQEPGDPGKIEVGNPAKTRKRKQPNG